MSRIWVLGAGQLGQMLKHAGMPLNLDVRPVDIESEETFPLQPHEQVTAEREQWPDTAATRQLAAHPAFVNLETFPILADRFTQKSLIDKLDLATAPWQLVETDTSADALHQKLGERVLLKRRTGGYDGRGQHWLREPGLDAIPDDWHEQAIAEQAIDFDEEMSVVGMRGADGQCFFYPLTLNLHVNGILLGSVAPLARLAHLQAEAEQMLGKLMNDLDYVGVMAMECFRVGDHLLINELAPRVHNSGHWTQAGANISQFEAHLRAVARLPLVQPTVKNTSVMVNLVGTERNDAWLSVPGAELYWYGKEVRPGRKVGHINFCLDNHADTKTALDQLQPLLPVNYVQVLNWLRSQLD
ncbi:5-(carboxyamino)imidazole ribonucleotide synthase [Oceanisphaera arctica]|uniref:N5-carboxyaminoimidazole ribonucleotide synthase n=1 Tax=Oceanisphaera arctica TaxID=641510 RepID=A0A2P5THY8_9GAMM|nr:5-(carboxyamino)imidazole ribonucleotide synthase [Oceanisphaera arctica]PPL14169.1 5-(carboxyamino)imidazole ribonucleotide synthase [Oceanisphaera arctica]GHA21742.1 N5-carboxyaminoimidazole ribonucleotide synthase [Oceanisphaera arctica]